MLTLEEPASTNAIQIIPGAERYAQQMEDLTAAVYERNPRDDDECSLNAAHFRHHLSIFPEGQFVAVDTMTDKVVGLTASMQVNHNPRQPMLTSWWELIGYGWLTTHKPNGEWLYGVESAVHPDYQGKGIGKQLTNARLETMRRLNLRGMIAGSAIISYHKVADTVPVEEYVADVIAGRRFDNNLSKQIKMGFKPLHIIPNYLPEHEDCVGYGVEMMIENPAYVPTRIGWQRSHPLSPQRVLG
jgi:ribosomal protein S18 acetylase RimI-like enzyme